MGVQQTPPLVKVRCQVRREGYLLSRSGLRSGQGRGTTRHSMQVRAQVRTGGTLRKDRMRYPVL